LDNTTVTLGIEDAFKNLDDKSTDKERMKIYSTIVYFAKKELNFAEDPLNLSFHDQATLALLMILANKGKGLQHSGAKDEAIAPFKPAMEAYETFMSRLKAAAGAPPEVVVSFSVAPEKSDSDVKKPDILPATNKAAISDSDKKKIPALLADDIFDGIKKLIIDKNTDVKASFKEIFTITHGEDDKTSIYIAVTEKSTNILKEVKDQNQLLNEDQNAALHILKLLSKKGTEVEKLDFTDEAAKNNEMARYQPAMKAYAEYNERTGAKQQEAPAQPAIPAQQTAQQQQPVQQPSAPLQPQQPEQPAAQQQIQQPQQPEQQPVAQQQEPPAQQQQPIPQQPAAQQQEPPAQQQIQQPAAQQEQQQPIPQQSAAQQQEPPAQQQVQQPAAQQEQQQPIPQQSAAQPAAQEQVQNAQPTSPAQAVPPDSDSKAAIPREIKVRATTPPEVNPSKAEQPPPDFKTSV